MLCLFAIITFVAMSPPTMAEIFTLSMGDIAHISVSLVGLSPSILSVTRDCYRLSLLPPLFSSFTYIYIAPLLHSYSINSVPHVPPTLYVTKVHTYGQQTSTPALH
jgi:hypothetical protein